MLFGDPAPPGISRGICVPRRRATVVVWLTHFYSMSLVITADFRHTHHRSPVCLLNQRSIWSAEDALGGFE
jgi:hypothetical protein